MHVNDAIPIGYLYYLRAHFLPEQTFSMQLTTGQFFVTNNTNGRMTRILLIKTNRDIRDKNEDSSKSVR
jgi:hypothetical protein